MLRFFVVLFLGLKFQSNLNEIDKFEQKSQADNPIKAYDWTPKDEAHVESKHTNKTKRVHDLLIPTTDFNQELDSEQLN